MGRPREVKMEDGTVYLQDFSPEVSAAMVEYLKGFVYAAPGSVVPPKVTTTLTEKAIGTRISKTTNKAQFVTVLYNGETGEAKVGEVVECDGLRDSSTKFKITAGSLNFV